ncbi:MAG: YbhB/YbcL family Raf kinase inhibitor-like protein [Bauldia sp.]|nr:YbhB/YbcL family Raf kinase inhibitor-like protein [Bauldia sp.]
MNRSGAAVAAIFATLAAVPAMAADFTLTSKALAGGIADAQVANVFGCSGGNVSPDLAWSGAPEGTRSFALTLYDPDAPTGSGFWHWVVVDIPGDATALPAGAGTDADALPAGSRQMRTDAGAPGYLGPCPPPGPAHRYVFTLTALKANTIDLPVDASAAMVGYMVGANALGAATLTVNYGR